LYFGLIAWLRMLAADGDAPRGPEGAPNPSKKIAAMNARERRLKASSRCPCEI